MSPLLSKYTFPKIPLLGGSIVPLVKSSKKISPTIPLLLKPTKLPTIFLYSSKKFCGEVTAVASPASGKKNPAVSVGEVVGLELDGEIVGGDNVGDLVGD
jgi:hypothetical protein